MEYIILFIHDIVRANPLGIFTELWPAIILADKRIPKLDARKQWGISSRSTEKGANDSGTPAGDEKLEKWSPCIWDPTIVIPIEIENGRPEVMIKWLVTVELYGIIPWGLRNDEEVRVTEMRGEDFCLTFPERPPICSFTRFGTKSWISSTEDCRAFGTEFPPPFLVTKWTKSKTELIVSGMDKDGFVNGKYKFPIFIG